jgi:glycosyltransferase involved in cell wall biosynthesis
MPDAKTVIIAPFWGLPGHVGNYRVERFIRWLAERGDEVVLVRGGERDGSVPAAWGREIVLSDPLFGQYGDASSSGSPRRRPNRLRRYLATWAFNPEPTIVWSRRAAAHPSVLEAARGARGVISSSPPESAHVAAARLARKMGAAFIMDMRDGWLDEPLRPLLQTSRLRRWREGRLEKRLLQQAQCIFVTSAVWREMLEARIPALRQKVVVLTNAYPGEEMPKRRPARNGSLTLLYSGRLLGGGGQARRAGFLLELLLAGLAGYQGPKGVFHFLGNLSPEDLSELAQYRPRFEERGWRITSQPAVPRKEMFDQVAAADGLLLLSGSHAAVPSKTFEYVASGKPVLAACPEQSAVWRIAAELPQFFLADFARPERAAGAVQEFLRACSAGDAPFEVPIQYSEQHLKEIFLSRARQ